MMTRIAVVLGVACLFSSVTHPMEPGRLNRWSQNALLLNHRAERMLSCYFGFRVYVLPLHLFMGMLARIFLYIGQPKEPIPVWELSFVKLFPHLLVQALWRPGIEAWENRINGN